MILVDNLINSNVKQFSHLLIPKPPSSVFFAFLFLALILLSSCAGAERFSREKETSSYYSEVRVLLDERESAAFLTIQSPVYLNYKSSSLVKIEPGNTLEIYENGDELQLNIGENSYSGNNFWLESPGRSSLQVNGKKYRGKIILSSTRKRIDIINTLLLEDYVKGILSREMPLGKGEENLEALKALAICARTYAVTKMAENKPLFDLFSDSRDQNYGGYDAERLITNKAVDETYGTILTFNNSPAQLYYHSTCGGRTEAVNNVFTQVEIPFLMGVEDGNEPFCRYSSRYKWEENLKAGDIVDRLINLSLLKDVSYTLEEIEIESRFESGRVNQLDFILLNEYNEEEIISVYGNNIRTVLRIKNGRQGLWSNFFEIEYHDKNKIIITGKGFGHGVGLCQWGAIHLSRIGWSYKDILNHYYPGTEIGLLND